MRGLIILDRFLQNILIVAFIWIILVIPFFGIALGLAKSIFDYILDHLFLELRL